MTGTFDADGADGGPVIDNKRVRGGFRWTTYAERLQKAGISWKVYQQQDNYGCNVLEYSKAFMEAPRDSDLHNRGVIRDPEGKFEHDAINDNLPAVSWIIPTSIQSEHPDYMPAAGAAFVASKLNASMPRRRAQAWATSDGGRLRSPKATERMIMHGRGRPWTPKEDRWVRTLSVKDAARRTNRTVRAVYSRRAVLGCQTRLPWTPGEEELVRMLPTTEVARRTGRTVRAVEMRRFILGVVDKRVWTEADDWLLRTLSIDEAVATLRRTRPAIRHRRSRLRLTEMAPAPWPIAAQWLCALEAA